MSIMNKITVLGGHGFVGSRFCFASHWETFVNSKQDKEVHSKNVINFVSTVDNYNVLNGNVHVDIDTNLTYLVDSLESWRNNNDAANGCYNFVSSWFVYGKIHPSTLKSRDNIRGIREDYQAKSLLGFYTITKHAAELLVQSYCEQFNLNYRILRLGSVMGNDPKASSRKNVMAWLIKKIKNNEDILVYDRNGRYYRDFISADHTAGVIQLILDSGQMNQVYNIGNGKPLVTVIDILNWAKAQTGSTSKINFMKDRKEHSIYLNVDKIKVLGFKPNHENYMDMFKSVL